MAYYVYILQSDKDGSYYIGYTKNIEERVERHNEGRSSYTKAKVPWRVIYHEVYGSREEVVRRERELKRMKSQAYIDQVVRTSRL